MANELEQTRIAFRYLTTDDLPLMHRWLNQGPCLRWYGLQPTRLTEVTGTYEPRLYGESTVLSLIASYDGHPVGYIQRYFTRDHDDYWGRQHFPDDTAGIDLFIGEETLLYRGLGPLLTRAFLRTHVFAGQAGRCLIDPHPENRAAIRAYEKVGFRHLRTLHPPEHTVSAYLMLLEAHDVLTADGWRSTSS